MKILIFSLTYFPFVGGAEVAVKEITQRIKDVEFDLITARLDRKLPREEKIGNVNVTRVGFGSILDKYSFPFLAFQQAKKLNKDYSIVWGVMANYAGLAALFYKLKDKKVKYLLTLQSGDTSWFIWQRTWFWYPLYKMIYTKADLIQVISRYLEKRARKYGFKGEVSVIPNGVDLEIFTQKTEENEKQALREKLGLKSNDKVVITVSRLVAKNAVGDLIRAIKDLPVKLLIIGQGRLEHKLQALAQEIGNNGKVLFLGYIKHQDLPKYLSISGVFVRPSISEGLGNAFLEAMAARVPVIGTPVGGIPDFLKDGQTGLFCQLKDPLNIAEKIRQVLNDQALVEQIKENAHQLVTEDYSWDKIAQKMRKIFYSLRSTE